MAKKKQTNLLKRNWTLSFAHLVLFAVVFAGLGALVIQTFAAPNKGGGKPGGSSGGINGTISLVLPPVKDANSDGLPNFGDQVRFNISTTATTQPWVLLKCYVNGALVAQGSEGYFSGALDDGNFGLYSPQWSSGGANCTADLAKYTSKGFQTLASTSFQVNP